MGRSHFGDRFLISYYGNTPRRGGRCLSRPIGTLTAHDVWAVVDYPRMRMLSPEEGLKLTFGDLLEGYSLLANRREKMRAIGNAVSPPVAEAILASIINA